MNEKFERMALGDSSLMVIWLVKATYQELTKHLANCLLLRLVAPKTLSPRCYCESSRFSTHPHLPVADRNSWSRTSLSSLRFVPSIHLS